MTSQPRKQIITIHMFYNNSKINGNLAIVFA